MAAGRGIDPVPAIRVHAVNSAPVRPDGTYVLYWMVAQRRTASSFALQHAVRRAQELGVPLLVLEALRVGYRWASDRLHRFVLDGMAANARECERAGVRYLAYVEDETGNGEGLLAALAERACVVVTDEYPCFFLPRMIEAAGRRLRVLLEQVDGNGLLPLRASERAYPTAYAFRRFLQKSIPEHLGFQPVPDPLRRMGELGRAVVPRQVLQSWRMISAEALDGLELSSLPIDHGVRPVGTPGGSVAARKALRRFVDEKLSNYGEERNQPEIDATSGLSPYLHFGHLSPHDVLEEISAREEWTAERLHPGGDGRREGWWDMSGDAEAFLDQVITWRELGYAFCFHRPHDYDRFDSLPDWARATLLEHAGDAREHVYWLDELEAARTHDELWNAAQAQLVHEGRIHNYLRMLWGKKILEWSPTPETALEVMIELNNKYALDGRDPNSYSGIFWTLGRFDRPWGPERPVFGVVRYMSSANTARKLRVKTYIEAQLRPGLFPA